MLLDILQHPHLKPTASLPLLSLVVMVTWHLGRLGSNADVINLAVDLSKSLSFTLPAVSDVRPQRKDDDQEKDASGQAEKVAQLRKRTWRMLSETDHQELQQPSWGANPSSGERLSVQDAVVRLQSCLCQRH